MNNIIRRFAPIIAARLIQLAFGFFVTFIVAGWLSPDDLGRYYMATAVSIGCHFIVLNSLHYPIQRLMPSNQSERRIYLSTLFMTSYVPCLIGLALFLALSFSDSEYVVFLRTIAICVSFAFSETLFSQVTNTTSAMRQPVVYLVVVAVRSATIFVIFTVLKPEEASVGLAILFFVVGNIFSSVWLLVFNRQYFGVLKFSPAVLQRNLDFSWPYSIASIFGQIISRGDRLIIGVILGPAASGVYSVASDLSRRTLQGICINARLALVRDAVEAYENSSAPVVERHIYNIISSVLIVGVPTACVLSVFGAFVFGRMLPEEIVGEATELWRLAPFVFLFEALRTYGYSLPFELSKKTYLETAISGAACLAFMVIFLPLIYAWQLEGAAIALGLTFNVLLALSVLLARKKIGIKVPVVVVYLSLGLAYLSTSAANDMISLRRDLSLISVASLATTYGVFVMLCQAILCHLLRPRVRS